MNLQVYDYNDGTYVANQKKRIGYEEAEVTIKDGKIEDIVIKRMTQKEKK